MLMNKVEDKAFIHTITPLKHKTKSHKIEAKSYKAEIKCQDKPLCEKEILEK